MKYCYIQLKAHGIGNDVINWIEKWRGRERGKTDRDREKRERERERVRER